MKLQLICSCSAYSYPHRFKSGNCTGWEALDKVFESSDTCTTCGHCVQTGNGQDDPIEYNCRLREGDDEGNPEDCPGLSEIVREKFP